MKIDKQKFTLAMVRNCYSNEQLSEITGIANVTLTRIKNGTQKPRTQTLGKIAKALNVDVSELLQD